MSVWRQPLQLFIVSYHRNKEIKCFFFRLRIFREHWNYKDGYFLPLFSIKSKINSPVNEFGVQPKSPLKQPVKIIMEWMNTISKLDRDATHNKYFDHNHCEGTTKLSLSQDWHHAQEWWAEGCASGFPADWDRRRAGQAGPAVAAGVWMRLPSPHIWIEWKR